MKWALLYFDDQVANIEAFTELLSEKFKVTGTSDVMNFSKYVSECCPHAYLLDVHMPGMDGHALFEKIIAHPHYNDCPIFFISDDDSDATKLLSYKHGAIDFLPRSLKPEEIVARLTNKIKFHLQIANKLGLGNLALDIESMKSTIFDENVDLTLLELRVLSNLLRVYPEPLTRMELIQKVWGTETVKPGTINTHLTNLKPKIEKWNYQIKVREENIIICPKVS